MRQLSPLVFCLLILSACGSGNEDLTRKDAQQAINTAIPAADKAEVALCSESVESGVQLGLWNQQRELTSIGSSVLGPYFDSLGFWWGTLRHPVKIRIDEVTGIAGLGEGSQVATVEFRWSYADVPEPVHFMVATGFLAEATFRLYDDGWRLDEGGIDFTPYANKSKGCAEGTIPQGVVDGVADLQAKQLAAEQQAASAEEERVARIIARFQDNADGTVTDRHAGLMWIKQSQMSINLWAYDWAVKHCESSTFAGFDDWRLPTRAEWETLLDPSGVALIDTPDRRFFGVVDRSKATAPDGRTNWVRPLSEGICLGDAYKGQDNAVIGWYPKKGFSYCAKRGTRDYYTCARRAQ